MPFGIAARREKRQMKKIILLLFMLTKLIYSQEIHLRTVPLAAGNQGDFYPSLFRGMGNLSIAFDDPISDPLINPAKIYKLEGLRLFFSPTRNTWSNEDGRAVSTSSGSAKYTGTAINSMPFGLFMNKDNFFTGGVVSYQSYSSERSIPNYGLNSNLKSDVGNNVFLFGLLGAYFPELKLSVGGSVSWSELDAMDGVNLLYPGSNDIKQYGRSLDYKIGFLGELSERDQLEFVIARTTYKSSHEVTYGLPYLWYEGNWISQYRTELNKDESKGWIIHTKYSNSINDEVKVGAIFTVNWKEHSKIPNYALANIPRDPGSSTAYNIGIGIVNSGKRTTLGFEYIYEPMTSYTWAEAGENNPSFPLSFKTVENFFDFYNHIIRGGIYTHTDINWLDYRLGIQLYFNKYNLQQNDNILNSSRTVNESWLETTLCGGLTANISGFQILYSLQIILGNGIVGSENNLVWLADAAMRSESDFLIAPNGSLVVDEIPLVTQQISFVYNLK
jgi:hypothetical protein